VASAQLAHLGILTVPESLRPQPFRTLLAAETRPDREAEPTPARATRLALAAKPTPLPAKPTPLPAKPVPAETPPAVSAAPRTAPIESRLVPDFRGETLASARRIAAEDSLELELEGDSRGLAVEQHPDPGTVVIGHRPRVRLRFTLDPRHRGEG
jgi:hypothetical protein